jgi:hypothetical protein
MCHSFDVSPFLKQEKGKFLLEQNSITHNEALI